MNVYKVLSPDAWSAAQSSGAIAMAGADAADGYMHLSTAGQLAGTLQRHFGHAAELVLLAFEADALGDALRWEPSRGGELFPHFYGRLAADAVVACWGLTRDADGDFALPVLA